MPSDDRAGHRRGALARFVDAVLAHRRLPVIAALLGILLVLPSLGGGWATDDYYHQFAILGPGNARDFLRSPMEMFRFLDGDPDRTHKMMDMGLVPWWTYPGFKGVFWRPLTVLTHCLDYWLWPASAALMHLQSILWYGAVVAAVACLYRRLASTAWVAGAAALLYAVDDAHGMAAGWVADRNALLATFFGVLAVLAHDRWRRDGQKLGLAVGPVFLALSLLSAEAGIGVCAYLAAYAIAIDRGPWRARCLSLVPYLAVVLVWRVLWTSLGYGVMNSGYYVDPIGQPGRFAASVLRYGPVLLLGQWATPPSDLFLLLKPPAVTGLLLTAAVFLSLLAIALTPLLRRERTARFWAIGMLLSLIPVCAAFPMDRLLLFVGIGAMGLLAQFFALVFGRDTQRPSSLSWRLIAVPLAWALVVIHCILAPLALPVRVSFPLGSQAFLDQFRVRTPFDESIARQDVVIINAPSEVMAGCLPIQRALEGQPVPRHTRVLAPTVHPVVLSRPDAHTLVIRPMESFMSTAGSRLLRGEDYPMSVGDRVELTGLTIEVTAVTTDGRPAEAAFRFAVPLEDPSLRWLQWTAGNFVAFTPPAIGSSIEIRQPPPLLWPPPRTATATSPTAAK
jgi:hypothetical protein